MGSDKGERSRTIPIRYSLITNVVGIIALLGLAIVVAEWMGARRTIRNVAESLTGEKLQSTRAQMQNLLEIEPPLLQAAEWGMEGLLELDQPGEIESLLLPFMRQHPWMNAVSVADSRGRDLTIVQDGIKYSMRQTNPAEWGQVARWTEWALDAPSKIRFEEELSYDPRVRPWYFGATERADEIALARGEPPDLDHVYWSEPHTLDIRKRPGISTSVAFLGPDKVEHVVVFQVLLWDVNRVTSGITGSQEDARVIMMTSDERIIGLPWMAESMDDVAMERLLLKRPWEVGIPLVADAAEAMRGNIDTMRAFDFESGGETWWGEAMSNKLEGADTVIQSCVFVPESSLLGGLRREMVRTTALTLGAAIIAILWTVRLARRYSNPIEALAEEGSRISRGDVSPGTPIESSLSEVRRLDDVLGEMRESLGTLFRIRDTLQPAKSGHNAGSAGIAGYDVAAWGRSASTNDPGAKYAIRHQTVTVWDQLDLPDQDRGIWALGDATSEGIECMFLATSFRAMLHVSARVNRDIWEVLTSMNKQMLVDLPPGQFVTAWVGELDGKAHTLKSCSAGLRPLYHYHAATRKCQAIHPQTMPLGVFDGAELVPDEPIKLERGDVFVVLSDAIYLLGIQEGTSIGAECIQECIEAHASEASSKIVDAIRATIRDIEETVTETVEYSVIVFKRE